ncbi:MAG: hypothetical protein SGPRY_009044, partial [Prymnesium sp.]
MLASEEASREGTRAELEEELRAARDEMASLRAALQEQRTATDEAKTEVNLLRGLLRDAEKLQGNDSK